MSLDVMLINNVPEETKLWQERYDKSLKEADGLIGLIPLVHKYYNDNKPAQIVLYDANMTHNLGRMAEAANIYKALWRPYLLAEDCPETFVDYDAERAFENAQNIEAKTLIPYLEKGLEELKAKPEYFKTFDSPNGWGIYEHFLPFVEDYLNACKQYPDSIVVTDR